MTLKHSFAGTETKAEKPINQDLMDLKIRENIEDLANQIDSISIDVGGDGAQDTGAIGQIVMGGDTNDARFWKRRFHPLQHMLNADNENPSGFDPEGKSLKNELLTFIQSNDTGLSTTTSASYYLGQGMLIAKDSEVSFKIKKGVNFFNIIRTTNVDQTDNVAIFIDGQTPSSLGLVDENGDASLDTFSNNTSTLFYQSSVAYYGLDGEEHIITIQNNDSSTRNIVLEAVEIGYKSPNPTIDENIKINKGKALVRGSQVSFDENELTFSKLDKNGHTGSIICNNAGTLSALDGESPAMTQVKAEETIAFSGAVTQLPVKNNFYFPENGICVLSTPHGAHHLFSFNGKTDTLIQSHSLDNVLWQSKPTLDFTSLSGFNGGSGEAIGDLNINYWGTAPIVIDSTNNKIDFKVTIGGSTTTHVATITNGRYSADLVPLEKAVRDAMQSAKSINGEYHLKYNATTHLWEIYVDDIEIESFELLFSTGVNVANSVHTTLGFAGSDLSGSFSYLASDEKEHLCCKVFDRDYVYMPAFDPRIKYSQSLAGVNTSIDPRIEKLMQKGYPQPKVMSSTGAMIQIFPDEDCSGLSIDFMSYALSSTITVQIDDGQCLYLLQNEFDTSNTSHVDGRVQSAFISFPRGSRKITIRQETSTAFYKATNAEWVVFFGCRQYFTKPAFEKLTTSQAIIETFDISPLSLYATIYGHNGGLLYSPTGTDNINTITESGTWTASPDNTTFNGARRYATVVGDYVEVDFTLQGDGGGIMLKTAMGSGWVDKIAMFLSQSAIVEGTDRVANITTSWAVTYYDQDAIGQLGLSAGTYKARFKHEGIATQLLQNTSFVVVDTVAPEENKNVLSDVSGTGQSVTYPINVRREAIQQDSGERIPLWLERSGYKEGRNSKINYKANGYSFTNLDDASSLITNADHYYGLDTGFDTNGDSYKVSAFCKSVSIIEHMFTSYASVRQPFIDGVQTLNSYSSQAQVKGGTAPSTVRNSATRAVTKQFELSCSHNTGLIFNIADTRGFKNDRTVILYDGTNYEKAVISSFVVGTSFTIKKSLTTVVATNVTKVFFYGFHTLEIVSGVNTASFCSAFEYEPLTISSSKALIRRSTSFKYEKVSITFRGVANGDDLFYPVHSDGVVGNWTTSTVSVISMDGGSTQYYNIDQDLKNIETNIGTLDIMVSSERLVPVLDEGERF